MERVKEKPRDVDLDWIFCGKPVQLRPDVIVTDEAQKKIILIDITVSFKNRTPAFHEARARKLEKDSPLADTLRAKGYEWGSEPEKAPGEADTVRSPPREQGFAARCEELLLAEEMATEQPMGPTEEQLEILEYNFSKVNKHPDPTTLCLIAAEAGLSEEETLPYSPDPLLNPPHNSTPRPIALQPQPIPQLYSS
ncbi:Homeodomain-only protein [Chelonia mydas]|uniref:Homeodomain-only protein n=1 Tax=Chelonia mydas TaxID=8469 RepID=M7B0H6_CHEMY|nr:Homeodomain-only protein [Chelonia mydas]